MKTEATDSKGVSWTAEHYVKSKKQCVAIYRYWDKVPYITCVFDRENGTIESGGLAFKENITPKTLCKKVLEFWLKD